MSQSNMSTTVTKELIRRESLSKLMEFGSEEKAIKWANNMLGGVNEEDLKFLRRKGFQVVEQYESAQRSLVQYIQSLKDGIQQRFQRQTIREVAQVYGLRFLPVTLYRGTLPTDVVQKMREYEARIAKVDGYSPDYRILAPKEFFKLEERLLPPPRGSDDPVLFAGVGPADRNGLHASYDFVHKWGDEHLTFARRLQFLPHQGSVQYFLFRIVPTVLCTGMLTSMAINYLNFGQPFYNPFHFSFFLGLGIPLLIMWVTFGIVRIDKTKWRLESEKWSSEIR